MKVGLLASIAAGALVLAAAAQAKGPDQATISGAGLDKAIVLRGLGENGQGPLGALTMNGGFFPQMFGQDPNPLLPRRPAGQLGPRYSVVYRVPGPAVPSRVRQDLYPYAHGGVVTYMRPGQTFWGTHRTLGGWFRGTQSARAALVRAGLPATAPSGGSDGGRSVAAWIGGGLAAVALLAAAVLLSLRRRPRPLPA
ncbi:MAG: hypothetical protein QOE36_2037 [Gaiellaceae bacterium]|nr:hypothetical protein [Gaiellaceae bacterium]